MMEVISRPALNLVVVVVNHHSIKAMTMNIYHKIQILMILYKLLNFTVEDKNDKKNE